MAVNPARPAGEESVKARLNELLRPLWLAQMIFFSLALGVAAGILTWAGGDNPFTAVLTGGGSFGATLLVLLAVFHFATAGSKVDQ